MLFAKRKIDGKEFEVTHIGYQRLEGLSEDGEKADLLKGKYEFYEK